MHYIIEIYDTLQSYRKFAKLKRAALIAIAYTLSQDDIEKSRAQFERLDASKNGFITFDQLKEVLQHHNVTPAEVETMFNDSIMGLINKVMGPLFTRKSSFMGFCSLFLS